MTSKGFTTTNLHSDRWGKPEHGALRKAIHTSIAFEYEQAEDLAAVFQNRQKGFAYSRQGSPTVQALEQKITALEGGIGTICFATGMAAVGGIFLSLLQRDDHIIASRYLFGNTASLLTTLNNLGVTVTFVDATDVKEVEAAITPKTRVVVVETIANPVTQIADLLRIGELCLRLKLMYVVDNTMTSPYLFKPLDVHATFSVSSLSKYFGGHGAALGGSVTDCGIFDWSTFPNIFAGYKDAVESTQWGLLQLRKKGLRDFGGTLAPEPAHTLSMGSETMALRLDRACANASRLALFLKDQKQVSQVFYPGLPSHPQHALAQQLFRRPGALMSFVLREPHNPMAFLNALQVAVCTPNIGDTRTLVIPVAHTIFHEVGPIKRAEMGIADGLIRLSVGIEDPEDLIADFQHAFTSLG